MATVVEEAPAKVGETIVSTNGNRPWAGMGVTIEEAGMKSAEALKLAGLDWEVELWKAGAQDAEGNWHTFGAEDKRQVVRTDNNRLFGEVGKSFRPLQNHEAFLFGDDIIDSSEAHWIRAGSLKHGRHVWMVMELPESIEIEGYETEKMKPYIFISNGHDGKGSLTAGLTYMRLACNNAVNPMLKSSPRLVKIRHTKNMQGRMHEAKRVLGVYHQYTQTLKKTIDGMLHTAFSDSEFNEFLETLVPTEDKEKAALTRAEEKKADISNIWRNTDNLADIRNTRWGAYQAVVEYNDHHIEGRGDNRQETRFTRILTGPNIGHEAFRLLSA